MYVFGWLKMFEESGELEEKLREWKRFEGIMNSKSPLWDGLR
jgi:hypothetical protein